ncbi:hypothetical protein XCR_4560 [Xanthomonas campestris pv. raphani 756C]|nr:hypothetical protein XCR_4560 [Xanthomonas campestris pv. raphani 756C]
MDVDVDVDVDGAGVTPAAWDGCVVGALLQAASSSADSVAYIHRLDMRASS